MQQTLIVAFFFLSTLTGCSSITSETGFSGADGPGGAFWYVRDGAFSSRIFHCPPQTQIGPHRCVEAQIIDYAAEETPGLPPQQMAPQPMMPQQQMMPQPMMPAPTTGGCMSDLDCKGGRICRNRACSQP